MEYLVSKTPEQCLALIEMYFIREWPHKGTVNKTDTRVSYLENQGCLAFLLATQAGGVNVFALPEGGKTRLTIDSTRTHYAQTINAWVQGDLGATPVNS